MSDKGRKKLMVNIFEFSKINGKRGLQARFLEICNAATGMGISHPELDAIDDKNAPPADQLVNVQRQIAVAFEELIEGRVAIGSLQIEQPKKEVDLISSFKSTSQQSTTRLLLDPRQSLSDALFALFLLLIWSRAVEVRRCPVCKKMFLKFDRRKEFCSPACKQQEYRDTLSPEKKKKQAMKRAERYRKKKKQEGR